MFQVPDYVLKMKPADAFQHGESWGIIVGAILGMIAVAVALDARERGFTRFGAMMWAVAIQAAALPTLIYYLVIRSRRATRVQQQTHATVNTCRYCEKSYTGDPSYCPHCSRQLKGAEEIHKRT